MSPLFYMLKPLHRHLIYYKNTEWAIGWNGVTCFHAAQEMNSHKVSQVKVKARVSKMHFVVVWNKSVWKRWDVSSSPATAGLSFPSVRWEYLTTLIFTFMQGKLRFPRWMKKKTVLPRVELALMRFSCNYFSAITIRTTTTEDLIRQWEGLILLPGDSD